MQTGSPAGGVLGEMVHWCTWKSPSRNVFGLAEEYIIKRRAEWAHTQIEF